jgi:hypothetical protein
MTQSLTTTIADTIADRRIRKARQRIDDQKKHLQHMIVEGCATQSAEDLLAAMYKALQAMHPHGTITR